MADDMDALAAEIAKRKGKGGKSAKPYADDGAGANDDAGEGDDNADDAPVEESAEGVQADAADELASILGVSDADKGRFATALKQYVKACDMGGDEEE